MQTAVRVRTGSRLHFGLLDTAPPFGGIGVMIDHPATEVVVTPSDQFECPGDDAQRITSIARRISRWTESDELPRCRIEVVHRAAPHSGLGSGTQLSMAAAEALCHFLQIDASPDVLALEIAKRGKRSAVGVHGYFHGGLVFEANEEQSRFPPLQTRVELPSDWTVIVVRPAEWDQAISGETEQQHFDQLPKVDSATVARLRNHIEMGILSAAKVGDFEAYAKAVERYNASSGRLFEAVQGGPYNGPAVTAVVQWLKHQGAKGVGQSSWGPGVFAWFKNRNEAEQFLGHLPNSIQPITLTAPRNQGRILSAS